MTASDQTVVGARYAGFWRRLAAMLIDVVVVNAMTLAIGFGLGLVVALATSPETANRLFGGPTSAVAGALIAWLYFALMETSPRRATLGKLAMGLAVSRADGTPLSFGRATVRHFGKFVSLLPLLGGFVLAAFTRRKQALHDLFADALVIQRGG